MNRTAESLLYLDACALNGVKPDMSLLTETDPEELYRFAHAQSLTAITCMALESAGAFAGADEELVRKWTDAKNKAIRKTMLLDAERREICRELDGAGIWYMPLKGILIKDMYPRFGMRQMADNDILFDADFRYEVRDMMLARGYEIRSFNISIEDDYMKAPCCSFEMHTDLFTPKTAPEVIAGYYSDIKSRLIADGDGSHGYHFSDEDFYVYVTLHAYRHAINAGTGLRTLLDTFVMNRTMTLDHDYIRGELTKLGAAEFEETVRKLSMKLFSEAKLPELTEEEENKLSPFIISNTYGSFANAVNQRVDNFVGDKAFTPMRRLQYSLSRVFVGRQWCRYRYPMVYRCPLLLPGLWVFRIVKLLTKKRGLLQAELKAVRGGK